MAKSNIKKRITRKCSVCGKRITITLDKDGYYRNGHYFGKLKIPIKNIGKELEYWECIKCYEKAQHEDLLKVRTLI